MIAIGKDIYNKDKRYIFICKDFILYKDLAHAIVDYQRIDDNDGPRSDIN